MAEEQKTTGLLNAGLTIAVAGVIITAMVAGGGILLPFMSIPWYVWAFVIFIFVIWLVRK